MEDKLYRPISQGFILKHNDYTNLLLSFNPLTEIKNISMIYLKFWDEFEQIKEISIEEIELELNNNVIGKYTDNGKYTTIIDYIIINDINLIKHHNVITLKIKMYYENPTIYKHLDMTNIPLRVDLYYIGC